MEEGGHSHHAFRKGFQSGLKRLGADDEAVKFLVGHDIGVRTSYIDPAALPLRPVVDLIPPINWTAEETPVVAVVDLDAQRRASEARKARV